MGLKSKLKSMVLAGAIGAAGAGVYYGVQPAKENTADNTKESTYERSTALQRERETYELRAGVLMPNQNETQHAYEERRAQLEKAENLLRQMKINRLQQDLKDAKNGDRTEYEIIKNELRRQSNESQKISFISYYTSEGQRRLKEYDENHKSQPQSVKTPNSDANESQKTSLSKNQMTRGKHLLREGSTFDF